MANGIRKTELGFNQWDLQDKPRMEDFNADNALADELIGALRGEKADKKGGAFSGAITAPQVNISPAGTNSTNISMDNNNLRIRVNKDGNTQHSVLMSGENGNIWPTVDGEGNLGVSNYRWKDLHLSGRSRSSSVLVRDDARKANALFQMGTSNSGTDDFLRIWSYTDDTAATRGCMLFNGETGTLWTNRDATGNLGFPTYRWNNIYATNGTIVTSDAREKEEVTPLDAQTMTSFLELLNPVEFKLSKGTSGRPHYGLIAQEVEEAMEQCGIADFAGLIKSPVLDDDGNDTGEVTYGLRYTEFIAVLMGVIQNQEKRIKALESK